MRNIGNVGGRMVAFCSFFAACGSSSPLNPGGDAGNGGSGGGGSGGAPTDAGGSDVAPAPTCPDQPPANGTVCAHEGQTCGWGADLRGDRCRTRAVCTAAQWNVMTPGPTSCPPLTDLGTCADANPTGSCTMNTTCTRPDGNACRCTNCRPTAPICSVDPDPSWYCPQAPPPGCPLAEPNFGIPCAHEAIECTYFYLDCGSPTRVCSHGVWVPGQTLGCPVSSRRAKKDIRYLAPDDVTALAAQTLRLRLATYEYQAPPYAGRRHLGFIIEDDPDSPAVDRDGDLVDLYGYTSLLLATTQFQQQKIQALEKRVQTLSRAVDRLSRARGR